MDKMDTTPGWLTLPSGIPIEFSVFTWTIEDFDKHLCLDEERRLRPVMEGGDEQFRSLFSAENIRTPKFVRGESVGRPSKWSLDLSLDDENMDDFMSLRLKLVQNFTSGEIYAKFRVSIVAPTGKILHSGVYDEVREWSDDQTRGPHQFISLETLWNSQDPPLLEGNSLRLTLELVIFGDVLDKDGIKINRPFRSEGVAQPPSITDILKMIHPTPKKKRPVELYLKLWNSKEWADLTLTCEGATFLVHKAIISSGSPYFAAMFRSGMRECQEGTVTLSDMAPRMLEMVLEFIYTGTVAKFDWKNTEMVVELLKTADKLMVDQLKDIIFERMWQDLTFPNLPRVLTLASLYNPNEIFLRKMGIYLAQNIKANGVADSQEFKSVCSKYPNPINKMVLEGSLRMINN